MKKKKLILVLLVSVFLLSGITVVAFAGTAPSPFYGVIENHTDQLDQGSPLYNGIMKKGCIDIYFINPGDDGIYPYGKLEYDDLPAGQTATPQWHYIIGNILPDGEATFLSRHGGLIDTHPIYSFLEGTQSVGADPEEPPYIELSGHGGLIDTLPIFGFASPGVMVGITQIGLGEATIDIHPDTLNLKSKGKWITCFIELSFADVNEIDINSIVLSLDTASISAELSPSEIGDYDSDGVLDLMVKFDRSAVQDMVSPGAVELTVTGSLLDGSEFSGIDTLFVIDKGQEHTNDDNAGSVVF